MKSFPELFENHLEFLATQRAKVTRTGDGYRIDSDRAAFTYAVLPHLRDRSGLERYETVSLVPIRGPWDQKLDDPRFEPTVGFSYMTLESDSSLWSVNPEVQVERAETAEQMAHFSDTQALGFSGGRGSIFEEWRPWLHERNLRNLRNPGQDFYVGYLDGKPVGTTIVVRKNGIAGIYGVATPPELRKKGIATSIMARAIRDAREKHGCSTLTLQVAEDSYAQKLYEKQGWVVRFAAKMFAKKKS
ncbi:MAG: GNAT family N-acetyltransferase [Bdellovibrionota bacterium]